MNQTLQTVPPSAAGQKTWLRRTADFLLTLGRIVLAILSVLLAPIVLTPLVHLLPVSKVMHTVLFATVAIPASCAAYAGYVRLIERRLPTELGLARAGRELIVGLLIGSALFTLTVSLLWLLGCYHATASHRWSVILLPLASAVIAGFTEELLMRAILFRISEESLGTWLALALTAALFGALHLANPGATLLSGVAIMLEAGILLAAAYSLTKRLWLPIGIHIAWNFVQGGIFGIAVSGHESVGLLQGRLSGPAWLSGGTFGAENSIIAIAVCLGMGVYLLRQTMKKGHIIPPFWNRKSSASEEPQSLPSKHLAPHLL